MRSRRAIRARSRAAAQAAHRAPWEVQQPTPPRPECEGCARGWELREVPGYGRQHYLSGAPAGPCTRKGDR